VNVRTDTLPHRARGLAVGVLAILLMASGISTHVPFRAAAATLGEQSAHGKFQPRADECVSLEACYDYSQMDEFLNLAWGFVRAFARARYGTRVLTVNLRYVPNGESGSEPCADRSGGEAKYTDRSFEYCPTDNTIYIGQNSLWQFYNGIGDAAAVVGLAHEYAHHLQTAHNVPAPTNAAENVLLENQADCIAGAWFGYAEEMAIVEPDDLSDLTGLLDFIGSSEADENRDHGTTSERRASLEFGRAEGLQGCSDYFPSSPVYSVQDLEEWNQLLVQLRDGNAWIGTWGRSPAMLCQRLEKQVSSYLS
jgi:Putative neutral zinc metallopeptidase